MSWRAKQGGERVKGGRKGEGKGGPEMFEDSDVHCYELEQ